MITSLFSKSKPINFIAVFLITLLALLLGQPKALLQPSITDVVSIIVLFLAVFVSLLLVNFITIKNKLIKTSSFDILLYAVFLLSIPKLLSTPNVIFANVFVLLGLRRLISLHTQRDTAKKLFDAGFWFAVAAMFYFWTILFFVLILIMLIMYTDNSIRHWLIPFVAVACVFVLACTVSVLCYHNFFDIFKSLPFVSFDYSIYNHGATIIPVIFLLCFGIWASFFYVNSIKNKKKLLRPSFKIVPVAVFFAIIIAVIAPNKNGSELLFVLAPLAIIVANYLEYMKQNWFKELFLALLIFTPFLLVLFY